jgi:hypothetical protein
MNTESVDGTKLPDGDLNSLCEGAGPGSWCYLRTPDGQIRNIAMMLPGQTVPQAIDIAPHGTHGRPQWTLSGDLERPTLSPSIHLVGFWHGWLREGRFVSC